MEQPQRQDNHHPVIQFLEVLRHASKDLQNNPIFTTIHPQTTLETLTGIESEADTELSSNPNLSKVSQLLCSLKTLLQKLKKYQGYSIKSLLSRQITNYKIYQVAVTIEAEIQAYIDRECIQDLVKTLQEVDSESEEEKVRVLKELEKRLLRGFDREFQELVLKAKVFSILESLLCDSSCSKRIREHAGLAIVALVKFNKDVFVGLVLMGPAVQALISMASCCSIQVLCSLIRLIRIPLIDEIELDGEIPRIICLLSSEDLSIQVASLDCICEMAYFGRIEVIQAMLEQGLIKKLVELQRSVHGDNLVHTGQRDDENGNGVIGEDWLKLNKELEREEMKIEENRPFTSCVARFAVQVEVGEGLSLRDKQETKVEILRRVREASVSEAEAATIIAEVLWGSSP